MGLIAELGSGPVGLDTAIFIYFIEEHPRYLSTVLPVFTAIDGGELTAATSALTLLETIVVPYRSNDSALAERYEALLTRSRGLQLVQLGLPLLRAAALIRAILNVKTPDALQLAAALSAGCTSFLTNDRKLSDPGGLRVLQLADYLPEDPEPTG